MSSIKLSCSRKEATINSRRLGWDSGDSGSKLYFIRSPAYLRLKILAGKLNWFKDPTLDLRTKLRS